LEILEELFTLSAEFIKQSQVSDNASKLRIYSLYKQATQGDCGTPQPQMFDLVGRSKWGAWNGLRGMTKSDAMAYYIKTVSEVDPSISQKICMHFEDEQGNPDLPGPPPQKAKSGSTGISYRKVEQVDYSDEYSHPYFKPIEKLQDIEDISHELLLQKNNEPAVYPLHFAIDKERADLVGKFLGMLTVGEIEAMLDAEGTGILEYAELTENEEILKMVKDKLSK
jgi:diazepam-binding inhibitor (GABA receptor modulating acyl-CoA-binding protein)